nr:transposase (putative), gypsy type [Tanacetum cinerariifolium]
MGRDTVQLETAVSTISQEYLLEFTSEYGISKALHPELPGPEDWIVDFPEGKVGIYTKFFEFANFRLPLSQFLFDILGYYQIHLSQLSVIGAAKQKAWEKYPAVLHQALRLSKKLEQPLLLGGREGIPNYRGLAHECSKRWDAGREYVFLRGRESTGHTPYPNPKTTRRITLLSGVKPQILPGRREMEDSVTATDSSRVPSTIERSPLDFASENPSQQSTGTEDQETATPEVPPLEDVPTMRSAPEAGLAERVAVTEPSAAKERRKRCHDGVDTNAPPKSRPSADVAQSSKEAVAAGDPKSKNTSFASMVGSPESIYRPEWGITNGSMLDTPQACQDLVDHVAPPGYFLELHHLRNDNFLKQYNVNLARQVVMRSQLRLRFEQEAKLLKKSVAQVARRDKRIQVRENEIKNLETLLEAEADMKKAAEDKSVSTLQEQVNGEEKLKAVFEEFKQYEDNWVEQRCAEMDAHLDALSIDFDEELYPHMLTAIAAGIAKGMCEGLKHEKEHGRANLDLEAIEAYNPKAEAKYIAALQALKNLKYPIVDQLEGLKDAPMDMIMASLHLESDTGDDAPQWVRELRPSSSQPMILVYPESCRKQEKCRVVCRTHGVGSAHHARSDGVLVSVPTVIPHGLAILLADETTQTETSDEASPQFLRSSSLPVIHSRIFIVPHVCLVCSMGVFTHTQRLGRMTLRTQSPRPLGLQPVYAAGRV